MIQMLLRHLLSDVWILTFIVFVGLKAKEVHRHLYIRDINLSLLLHGEKNVGICKFLEGTGLKKISNHPVTITAESGRGGREGTSHKKNSY
jgi:hypothetical protein